MEPTFFNTSAEFRAWLEAHHAAALSFGWIDGFRKRVDAEAYAIRFSPRRPGSIWSAVNTRRAENLISRGLMEAPGLCVFEARDRRTARQRSDERARPALDPALDAALRANQDAASYFAAQPPGYRKTVTFWIMSAKKPDTRARRLAQLIERSARHTRIDLLNPNRK